eukprot:8252786-Prorocentrum_lima.AAC.1
MRPTARSTFLRLHVEQPLSATQPLPISPRKQMHQKALPGQRFIAMMEQTIDGHFIFLDATV